MLIRIANPSTPGELALLYTDRLVFVNPVDGLQFVQGRAVLGHIPYAIVSAPSELVRSGLVSELSAFAYCRWSLDDKKFVCSPDGVVIAVDHSDRRLPLLAQAFWRAVGALYRYAFDPTAGAL